MTSQIFSNIYLNEFDRFVRHQLKPLAYVRYGDDFVLFAPNRKNIKEIKAKATEFLNNELKLQVNPKNNVICRAKDGLRFLGHAITDKYIIVDRHTSKAVLTKLTPQNASSYQSLKLVREAKEVINRELLEKLFAYNGNL